MMHTEPWTVVSFSVVFILFLHASQTAGTETHQTKISFIKDTDKKANKVGKWSGSFYFLSQKPVWFDVDSAQAECGAFGASLAEIDDWEEKSFLVNFYLEATGARPNPRKSEPLFYVSPVFYNVTDAVFQYVRSNKTAKPGVYNGRFGTEGDVNNLVLYGRRELKDFPTQRRPMHFMCEGPCADISCAIVGTKVFDLDR